MRKRRKKEKKKKKKKKTKYEKAMKNIVTLELRQLLIQNIKELHTLAIIKGPVLFISERR
jgi:hypothetical protein